MLLDRKCQDVYVKWEHRNTMWKIKHYLWHFHIRYIYRNIMTIIINRLILFKNQTDWIKICAKLAIFYIWARCGNRYLLWVVLWAILSSPLTTGRGTGAETCGLDDVFPPDDLCSHLDALCQWIYMHICSSIRVLFSLVYQLCLALW